MCDGVSHRDGNAFVSTRTIQSQIADKAAHLS